MDGELIQDEEELLKKHRLEQKQLVAKIQNLKKSVPKGDKRKKKEVSDEIIRLEKELKDKQNEELNRLKETFVENDDNPNNSSNEQDVPTVDPTDPGDQSEINSRISRAQKRRNKKEIEAKEREKRILEQSEKNKGGPRALEMSSIKKALKDVNLKLHNIPADGNCLYLAVNHQLEVKGQPVYSVNDLRKKTADFMREHKDEFMPFMCNEMDDTGVVSEESFENYCKDVASTKLWGGQLELRALSNILKCPIKIIQASGPPTLQCENFNGPELVLTYHRHLYRLGEHYNSTLPVSEEDSN